MTNECEAGALGAPLLMTKLPAATPTAPESPDGRLNRENFFFFMGQNRINLLDILVGLVLDFLFRVL